MSTLTVHRSHHAPAPEQGDSATPQQRRTSKTHLTGNSEANRSILKRVISESAPMHIQRLRFECMMQRIFAGYRTASASSSKVASTRSSSSI